MEITGWDTVVFTPTPPRVVFERIVASILSRWPGALVDGLGPGDDDPEPLASVPVELLPSGDGHRIFYRDTAMARHMEEVAYAPMDDGEGPFAVIARIRVGVEFAVRKLDEVRADDRYPYKPPLPYPAWLCASRLVEVTAVTPADPGSHPFSVWVLNEVKRACSGEPEPLAASDPAT